MIRVLHLIDGFELGGAQTVVLELARHLNRDHFHLEIAGLHGQGPFREELENTGVPVHVLSPGKWPPAYLVNFPALLARGRFDIVHCHLFASNWLGKPLTRLLQPGVKLVSHDHCNDALRWRNRMALLLDAWTNQCSDRILAVSESTREFLLRYEDVDREKVTTLHNGIDTELFVPADPAGKKAARLALGLPAEEFLVLGVGRLVEQKNFRGFLRVAQSVLERQGGLQFAIAGEGPQREELQTRIRESGCQNQIRLLGFVKDRVALMQTADVLFLPSLFEGMPMTLLEAMSCGLPVVGSAVDGVSEALGSGGEGWLFDAADEASFRTTLLRLKNDPDLGPSLGKSLRQRCRESFDARQQARKLDEIYGNLVNSG